MDDDDHDHDASYELLVPFVATASNGGPYDDTAFVAGFEMGKLWAWCAANQGVLATLTLTIRQTNRQQADLIAMNFGARVIDLADEPAPGEVVSVAPGDNEWAQIIVTRMPEED